MEYRKIQFYVYKVEKVDHYVNEAATLDYDYSDDFNKLAEIRGYMWLDYYITDTPDLCDGKVYCCGKFLIKAIECVATFEDEGMHIIPVKKEV